jgi:DNA invertase Pin-like site-specific DNA recombinase
MQTAALYIRVSTDDQIEYSPDAQKRLLTEYAEKHNMLVSNEFIFIDDGISGKKADKRPQFQHMIGLAKSKEHPFDVILVWKYSRFARNQEESIVYKSLLKRNNVDVISVSEPIIDGPFGTLIERIIEWMDEYYSIRLSEEVLRGMTEKALRGEYQAAAPFGYEMQNGQLIIHEENATVIRNIYDMYLNQSMSFFSIARHLNSYSIATTRGNKFENRTVRYIIQNPIYKGYVRWNPNGKVDLRLQKNVESEMIVMKGDHEPIVSEETWEKANEKLLTEYRPRYSKPEIVMSHWLSSVLVCSNCQGPIVSGGSNGGFQCNNYAKGKCNESHYVKYDKIENAVLNLLRDLIESRKFQFEIITSESIINNDILKTNLKKLEQKEKRVREAYINGIDSLEEYKATRERLEAERVDLESRIKNSKTIHKTKETRELMLNRMASVYATLLSDTDRASKNAAIKSIVRKIVYDKKSENIDMFLYFS